MMIGPMKRKVVTSIIVTAFVLILVFGAIFYFFMNQKNTRIAELEKKSEVVQRYVLTQDLLPGDIITGEDLALVDVKGESDPSNSFGEKDKDYMIGRRMKISALANTIVTESFFYDLDDNPMIDTRLQEYNMITLPSNLVAGDYIDVRLRFPTGEDYSVIVGKKIEEIGALKEQSNTIFLRLNEEEIVRMSSAIIESYINDGVYLYANKYVDPANQLFNYNYVNLVDKYNSLRYVEGDVQEVLGPSGEVISQKSTQQERSTMELALLMNISEQEVEAIATAVAKNDTSTLSLYKDKLVKEPKSIQANYPVKEEVATLIANNPNILNEVKAKYNVEALIASRVNLLSTELTTIDQYTGETKVEEGKISNIQTKLDKEIEMQRVERQEYLLNLLSK